MNLFYTINVYRQLSTGRAIILQLALYDKLNRLRWIYEPNGKDPGGNPVLGENKITYCQIFCRYGDNSLMYNLSRSGNNRIYV